MFQTIEDIIEHYSKPKEDKPLDNHWLKERYKDITTADLEADLLFEPKHEIAEMIKQELKRREQENEQG